jgi:hypothetical protein
VQPYDRDIGAFGQAGNQRHVDVNPCAEGRGRWKQQARKRDLGGHGGFARGVEQQCEVSAFFGGAQDRDFGGLLEEIWPDRDLGGRAAFSHARVGGAPFGAEFFQPSHGAGGEPEFTDG